MRETREGLEHLKAKYSQEEDNNLPATFRTGSHSTIALLSLMELELLGIMRQTTRFLRNAVEIIIISLEICSTLKIIGIFTGFFAEIV